jgi:rhodanese-related sulfurtransferase
MKPVLIIIFLLSACSLSLRSQVADSIKYLSLEPHDFQKAFLQEKKPLLIDVREFFEFRKSRIKGAINIPSTGGYIVSADTINKNKALFFYCYSGGRSRKAALFFYDKGFRNLYNLKGGITLWKKEKLPVVRKKLRPTSPVAALQSSQYIFPGYQIRYSQ